jgi:hypothetical protein
LAQALSLVPAACAPDTASTRVDTVSKIAVDNNPH